MSVKTGVKALARGIAEVGILKDVDLPRAMPRFGVSSCAESCHHAAQKLFSFGCVSRGGFIKAW